MSKFDFSKYRPGLELAFYNAGITRCELQLPGCTFGLNVAFAHSKKVRDWENVDDVIDVIAACSSCHLIIESLGKRKIFTMNEIVNRVKKARITQP
jgi:hypothetical protein